MSENVTPDESPADAPSEQANAARPGISFKRILMIILPVALVLVLYVVGFGVFDGARWLRELMEPPLVAGSGQVMYRGKPLANGELQTQHEKAGVRGAAGFLDADGRFDLQTERDGDWLPGAFVGKHKVTVVLYPEQQTTAGTPPITPLKYASFETTDQSIVVSKNADENTYVITLEEDPPAEQPATEESE